MQTHTATTPSGHLCARARRATPETARSAVMLMSVVRATCATKMPRVPTSRAVTRAHVTMDSLVMDTLAIISMSATTAPIAVIRTPTALTIMAAIRALAEQAFLATERPALTLTNVTEITIVMETLNVRTSPGDTIAVVVEDILVRVTNVMTLMNARPTLTDAM